MTDICRSPLHDKHLALEARMAEHGGFEMPLSYAGPLEEAVQTTSQASIFDLSHRPRVRIKGDDALTLLERACTADVGRQEDDTAAATLLCNERGGILDLATLVRLENEWLLIGSAGNGEKVLQHLRNLAEGLAVKITDQTAVTAMLAVVGPEAPGRLDNVLPMPVSELAPGGVRTGSMLIARYTALRMDLGPLWGLAVILPTLLAGRAWDFAVAKAGENAIKPAGLGAWDLLRIEAGVPAYGQELNETIDPFTAGLDGLLHWEHKFVGSDALQPRRQTAPARRRMGVVLEPPAEIDPAAVVAMLSTIPRMGAGIFDAEGAEIGTVTSGTFSVTMARPIAMAYVAAWAQPGARVQVELATGRGQAKLVALPFVG